MVWLKPGPWSLRLLARLKGFVVDHCWDQARVSYGISPLVLYQHRMVSLCWCAVLSRYGKAVLREAAGKFGIGKVLEHSKAGAFS